MITSLDEVHAASRALADPANECDGCSYEMPGVIAPCLPDGDDAQFADVEVRRTGNDDERWVCGSLAVRDEEGSLGPFRDFWVTAARVPGTRADIREVRANGFGRDDFLDRNSAHYRACFADGETE